MSDNLFQFIHQNHKLVGTTLQVCRKNGISENVLLTISSSSSNPRTRQVLSILGSITSIISILLMCVIYHYLPMFNS